MSSCVHSRARPYIGRLLDTAVGLTSNLLKSLALPRGLHWVSIFNALRESGTTILPTGSLGFLPQVSHPMLSCCCASEPLTPQQILAWSSYRSRSLV